MILGFPRAKQGLCHTKHGGAGGMILWELLTVFLVFAWLLFCMPSLKKRGGVLFCTWQTAQYLLTPLLESYQILIQWMPIESRWLLWIIKSHGQRSRSNCCLSTNDACSVSFDFSAEKLWNLVQWMPLKSRGPLLIFRTHRQRSRSLKKCPLNISRPLW